MDVYSVAKVITFIEICLTCNFLLVYELIGIYGKESVWLIIRDEASLKVRKKLDVIIEDMRGENMKFVG